jgi:phosphoserine aminotransferase
MKPQVRPRTPTFASGPCAKRPGWSASLLEGAAVARSHRGKLGAAKLKEAIDRCAALMGLPEGYRLGIVAASDTGAIEMAMWSLMGARGVDALVWESFGAGWVTDITKQLKLPDVRVFEAPYGRLPDLSQVDCDRDVIFTWNGTTSGVRVPNGDWIPADRQGLTFCDATSAIFAMALPLEKLDVVTFSWQKVLGGEAQHGMLALSPRAVERLLTYQPPWPLPKIFRLTKKGQLIDEVFDGGTINTPSLLCTEDFIDALKWAESIGGLPALFKRSEANLAAVSAWVAKTPWLEFLAEEPATRTSTSICLKLVEPWFTELPTDEQKGIQKRIVTLLENEGAAYDVGNYREAPPGLRLWGGATVETSDLEAVFPWLDWAYEEVKRGG